MIRRATLPEPQRLFIQGARNRGRQSLSSSWGWVKAKLQGRWSERRNQEDSGRQSHRASEEGCRVTGMGHLLRAEDLKPETPMIRGPKTCLKRRQSLPSSEGLVMAERGGSHLKPLHSQHFRLTARDKGFLEVTELKLSW